MEELKKCLHLKYADQLGSGQVAIKARVSPFNILKASKH